MMKKLFALICISVLPFSLIAQVNSWDGYTLSPYTKGTGDTVTGYMPIIGSNNKTYHLLEYVTCKTDSIHFGPCVATNEYIMPTLNDTVLLNGQKYYYDDWYGSYLREDTTYGRLYRYYPELGKEFLMCDMSLMEGDTFCLPVLDSNNYHFSYLEQGYQWIVDSIYYENGRKNILFDCDGDVPDRSFFSVPYVRFAFIEGVGPTFGPWGFTGGTEGKLSLLLCVREGTLTDDIAPFYIAYPEIGCYYYALNVEDNDGITFSLYPNPVKSILHVDFENGQVANVKISITDMTGMVIYQDNVSNNHITLDVSSFSAGMYLFCFENQHGKVVRKFVKR